LLDSRDYWIDLLQDGRPKLNRCQCGATLFQVDLAYEFRDNGDVRSVEVSPLLIDIKYSPTTEIVSRQLDPIQDPWLRPKRRQITAYWQPADAERFATYLVESHRARIFIQRKYDDIEECQIGSIKFYPELDHDLFFTNLPKIMPPRIRDPQKSAPFLQLSHPFHIVLSWPRIGLPRYPEGIGLLHYVEYSEEIAHAAAVVKQPEIFVEFARRACEWLRQNYVSERGRRTADNPDEYSRFAQSAANPRRS
jgi:hypothetical protein